MMVHHVYLYDLNSHNKRVLNLRQRSYLIDNNSHLIILSLMKKTYPALSFLRQPNPSKEGPQKQEHFTYFESLEQKLLQ
jgi:hypothetical protein